MGVDAAQLLTLNPRAVSWGAPGLGSESSLGKAMARTVDDFEQLAGNEYHTILVTL